MLPYSSAEVFLFQRIVYVFLYTELDYPKKKVVSGNTGKRYGDLCEYGCVTEGCRVNQTKDMKSLTAIMCPMALFLKLQQMRSGAVLQNQRMQSPSGLQI
jgi:hypothetical protein